VRRLRQGIAPGGARRALDLLLAGTAFVLLLPLLAVVALAVLVTSRGPIIFSQARVGQGGVPFTLHKFRSMRCGVSGPAVTTADDNRLTPIGKFLRLFGVDELPQLLNVLRGDMTLVGPRPETPALAARYPAGCAAVFQHRPGLTGPASVRLRDRDVLRSPFEDLEAYYLEVVVPAKAAVDMEFLAAPTLARTLGVIGETAIYLITWGHTRRAVPLRSRANQHGTAGSGPHLRGSPTLGGRSKYSEEPAVASVSHRGPIHLGLDVPPQHDLGGDPSD
jgi:lipopolysaccharide/colanic/teichoic acid biosynthesis glycosyltransferase